MRVLELFCGIGGAASAFESGDGTARVVAAVDHDRDALSTYQANFPHPTVVKNLARVPPAWFASWQADLWWMSPPCQPHGIRGAQRDLDDPRSEAFRTVIAAIREVRPRYVALENVPWFEGSDAHALLLDTLSAIGHEPRGRQLCPTQLGVPNERRRYYLVSAAPADLQPWTEPFAVPRPLSSYLLPTTDVASCPEHGALFVDEALRQRFGGAFHVVERDDPRAVSACFTSAYGRSPVYCGSYVREPDGRLRRFDPHEITALLGFPPTFRFPDALPLRRRYAEAGNSLSVTALREVARALVG